MERADLNAGFSYWLNIPLVPGQIICTIRFLLFAKYSCDKRKRLHKMQKEMRLNQLKCSYAQCKVFFWANATTNIKMLNLLMIKQMNNLLFEWNKYNLLSLICITFKISWDLKRCLRCQKFPVLENELILCLFHIQEKVIVMN